MTDPFEKIPEKFQAFYRQHARLASLAVRSDRSVDDPLASWFGAVKVAKPGEGWPTYRDKHLVPLLQVNLTELPFVPPFLSDLKLITVFVFFDNWEFPEPCSPLGEGWIVRAYPSLEGLEPLVKPDGIWDIKPFALAWEKLEADFPDSGEQCIEGFSDKDLDDYMDHVETQQGTKVGGYQFPVQGLSEFEDADLALQIDSDREANWMWYDSGFGYFFRSRTNPNEWFFDYQFY